MNIARCIGGLVLLFSLACPAAYAEKLNINTANAQTIADGMKGVGMKRAQAIIDYREKNGPFASIDDLIHIKGIGPKTLETNRDNLALEDPAQADKPTAE